MTDPALAATTILVVDDDRAFRVATRTMLEDEGYSVMLATNGEEALAGYKARCNRVKTGFRRQREDWWSRQFPRFGRQ